jgi:tetratricopeptide (TPR) repeat protein
MVLNNIGNLLSRAGRFDEAREQFNMSLDIYRQIGERGGEGTTLYNIGNVLRLQGRHSEAFEPMRQSIDMFVAVTNRKGEATARGDLGALLLAMMRPGDAIVELEAARSIASECELPQLEAQSLLLLGRSRLMLKEWEQAREYLHQASALAAKHGLDDIEMQAGSELGKLQEVVGSNDLDE